MTAAQVASIRGFIMLAVLTPWAYRHLGLLRNKKAIVLLLRCLAGSVSLLCYNYNLQHLNVGTALILADFAPLFVVLLSWYFLKERVSAYEGFWIFIIVGGAALLYSPVTPDIPLPFLLIGIGGAFMGSLAYMSLRYSAQRFKPTLIVWCFGLTTAIVGLSFPGEPFMPVHERELLLLLGIGIFALGGQMFMTYSYIHLRASIASALTKASVLFGIFLEAVFQRQWPTPIEFAIYIVILFALYQLQARHYKVKNA